MEIQNLITLNPPQMVCHVIDDDSPAEFKVIMETADLTDAQRKVLHGEMEKFAKAARLVLFPSAASAG